MKNMKEGVKSKVKVVHVHLLHGHKNYYFGSVSAVFRYLSESDIGCSETYLSHVLTSEGKQHFTGKAMITRSVLFR